MSSRKLKVFVVLAISESVREASLEAVCVCVSILRPWSVTRTLPTNPYWNIGRRGVNLGFQELSYLYTGKRLFGAFP